MRVTALLVLLAGVAVVAGTPLLWRPTDSLQSWATVREDFDKEREEINSDKIIEEEIQKIKDIKDKLKKDLLDELLHYTESDDDDFRESSGYFM